jgi:hypothetical protein
MATFLPSPKEITTPLINSLDDSFGDAESRHVVEGKIAKDRVAKGETASTVEEGGTPTREVFVSGGNEGKAVGNRHLMRG